jgi:hypothetical protein
MANENVSWVRSFAFSTAENGGWTAVAMTEKGQFTAHGSTPEAATEELRRVLMSSVPEAFRLLP